ncbi:MAG: hypothetical protein PWQ37_1174 [Candidatus Petromonas sp.]|jgi:putative membrane protein (TIGR04086 family)|nr:hypothetical protein [Candidatus Petromonas sp.]
MNYAKNASSQEKISRFIYFKSIAISALFALVVFLIMTIIVTFTSVSESIIPLVSSVVMILSIAFSGMLTAIKMKKNGLLQGTLTGAIYVTLIILLGWIFIDKFLMDKFVILKGIIGIVAGGIGGMLGVNMK